MHFFYAESNCKFSFLCFKVHISRRIFIIIWFRYSNVRKMFNSWTHFMSVLHFYPPSPLPPSPLLETSENNWFCDVFRGVIELENWREASNRNSRKRCEICSKLTMKTPKRLLSIPLENIRKPAVFWLFQGV